MMDSSEPDDLSIEEAVERMATAADETSEILGKLIEEIRQVLMELFASHQIYVVDEFREGNYL